MKKAKIISVVLCIAILVTLPAYAVTDRASDQLLRYYVDVTSGNDEILVSVNVIGMIDVTRAGIEHISVYEKYGSSWTLFDERFENDSSMAVNARTYLDTVHIDATNDKEYRVDVTIFAENSEGRDTRSFIRYI